MVGGWLVLEGVNGVRGWKVAECCLCLVSFYVFCPVLRVDLTICMCNEQELSVSHEAKSPQVNIGD